jgi:hypothetical protein
LRLGLPARPERGKHLLALAPVSLIAGVALVHRVFDR